MAAMAAMTPVAPASQMHAARGNTVAAPQPQRSSALSARGGVVRRWGAARMRRGVVAAAAAGSQQAPEESSGSEGSKSSGQGIGGGLLRPLRDFGFGSKSIAEGGVGLFLVTGVGFFCAVFGWVSKQRMASLSTSYEATMRFPMACGIEVGTPVRIRDVRAGQVRSVRPTLAAVEVVVDMVDETCIIPKNAKVEVNQHGLIAETMIDITPQLPLPEPKHSPLDVEACRREGALICNGDSVDGETGVSLDDLVAIMTRLSRETEKHGLDKLFKAADTAEMMMRDAHPLLDRVEKISAEIAPLLKSANDEDMLKSLQALVDNAAALADDVHELNRVVLTDENKGLIRDSIATLTETLRHVEGISGDVGKITGDDGTQYNLKQLVEALSRMLNE